MNRALSSLLLLSTLLSGCTVYSASLFDDVVGTGGASTGGGPSGGDTGGGTGGATGGATGGTSSGGGGDTGGATSGGSSTGGGTGGIVAPVEKLVDDFSGKSESYDNSPFFGTWARTGQSDIAWDKTTVTAMIQEIPDDTGNWALHIKATAPNDASPAVDWGGDTYATIKGGSSIDLTGYTKIRFRARSIDDATLTFKVSIEDFASTWAECNPSCPPHAVRTTSLASASSGWKDFELDLSTFTRASPAVDLTKVYAIHFSMDPLNSATGIDFWVDDISFVE